MPESFDIRPMLNAYPDSMGGTLGDIADLLERDDARGAFSAFYILPSLFNSDLDRGFSIIDYGLNELTASERDLDRLRAQGLSLKLDFILNHLSVLSRQFRDILARGDESPFRDFFIAWNRFWQGHGSMTEAGYIQPDEDAIGGMFTRKPGLPLLMVRFPDGREVPYWNTFYQKVEYPRPDARDLMERIDIQYGSAVALSKALCDALDAGVKPEDIDLGRFVRFREPVLALLAEKRRYMGQMDLNLASPLVWEHYAETLKTLAGYGARIVRLDAFAYAPKAPCRRNFLNEPETWEVLERVRSIAEPLNVTLLPEIHASYSEGIYEKLCGMGYLCYDFFLPGLMLDALLRGESEMLVRWAREQRDKGLRLVNMLGCHDGIPVLDLKGLLSDERIEALIAALVERGGTVKDLHGQKNVYYQVNAAYLSALGGGERALLLARTIQLFMPGKPQVWYLDLLAGGNDYEAVRRAGADGHKEINRTNYTREQAEAALARPIAQAQLRLLRFRNSFGAFGEDAQIEAEATTQSSLALVWRRNGLTASLQADLISLKFTARGTDASGKVVFEIGDAEISE